MQFKPDILPQWILIFAVLLIAGLISSSLGLPICLLVAVYALRGPKESIQALGILAFLIMIQTLNISMGRWVILFAAFSRTLLDTAIAGLPVPRTVRMHLLFITVVLILSIFASTFPLVSILKIITFAIGTTTVLLGIYRTSSSMEYWISWFYTFGIFVILASIPFYFLPAGYGRNGVGFQGITSHPQTFGPILVPITAFLTGLFLFKPETRNKYLYAGVAFGWLGMYMSQSRTSLFAIILAFAVISLAGLFIRSKTWWPELMSVYKRKSFALVTLVLLMFIGVQWNTFQQELMGFIYKDDNPSSVTGILEDSRGNLMDLSMANFRENPFTGIGFGVPSAVSPYGWNIEEGPFGLPIGASVEKGFMPSAVLEEIGLIGSILLIVLIIAILKPIYLRGDITAAWVITGGLLINLGEMIFFTMGGNGLYLWIVIGISYTWTLYEIEHTSKKSEKS